jgi:predicted esterase
MVLGAGAARHAPSALDIAETLRGDVIMSRVDGPHAGQPTFLVGETEDSALVLLHGRGGSAEDLLSLGEDLDVAGIRLIAPQAAGSTWYPESFLAPIERNQPYLDSALRRVGTIIAMLGDQGIPPARVALLGFSQGACLASEFVARNPRRYGAVMALTGGLIGPPGTMFDFPGSLDGTPVFLGASDPDLHVPFARVQETEAVLKRMGANVELRRYPGMPHTVNQDEMAVCRRLLTNLNV